MFERLHHRRVAEVLAALNADLLADNHCLFGGGTGQLQQAREVRADQYGIRTLVRVDGTEIKFEIVLEARIALEAPGAADRICGIATLTPLDMAASKLLANSDRWADDSVFSRDQIDLAMMRPGKALRQRATDKARRAYGGSIDTDLAKAADALLQRPGRMERCMDMLQMAPSVPPALLRKHIKALLPAAPRATHSDRP